MLSICGVKTQHSALEQKQLSLCGGWQWEDQVLLLSPLGTPPSRSSPIHSRVLCEFPNLVFMRTWMLGVPSVPGRYLC